MKKEKIVVNKNESGNLSGKESLNKNEALENQLELEFLLQNVEKTCDKEIDITEKAEDFLSGKQGSVKDKKIVSDLLEKTKKIGLDVLRNATKKLLGKQRAKIDRVRSSYVNKHIDRIHNKIVYNNDDVLSFYTEYVNGNVIGEFTEKDREDIEQRTQTTIKRYHDECIRLLKIELSIESGRGTGRTSENLNRLIGTEYRLGMHDEVREILDFSKSCGRLGNRENFLSNLALQVERKYNNVIPNDEELLEKEFGYIPELYLYIAGNNEHAYTGDRHDDTKKYLDLFFENYKEGDKYPYPIPYFLSQYYKKHFDELTEEKGAKLIQILLKKDTRYIDNFSSFLYTQINSSTPEVKNNIFEAVSDTYLRYHEETIATLPLTKEDIEKIYSYDGEYSYKTDNPEVEGKSFEKIRSLFGDKGIIIPLLHPDLFDVDVENRKKLLLELKECGNHEKGILLIESYGEFEEIDEETKKDVIYSCLLKVSNREYGHSLEKIEKTVLYMRRSGIFTEEEIGLFTSKAAEKEGTSFTTKILDKIQENPDSSFATLEVIDVLERVFCDKSDAESIRHTFFEVLEGKKRFENFDLLYEKYLEQQRPSPEEFISLFIIKKQLDRSYAQKYIEKIQRNESQYYDQLQELKSVGSITEEDCEWAIASLRNSLSAKSLTTLFIHEIGFNEEISDKEKNSLATIYTEKYVEKIRNLANGDDDLYLIRYLDKLSNIGIDKELELKLKRDIIFTFLQNESAIYDLVNYAERGQFKFEGDLVESDVDEAKNIISKTKNTNALSRLLNDFSNLPFTEKQKIDIVKNATESLDPGVYSNLIHFLNREGFLTKDQKKEVIDLLPVLFRKNQFSEILGSNTIYSLFLDIKKLPFKNEIPDEQLEEIFTSVIEGEDSLFATCFKTSYAGDTMFAFLTPIDSSDGIQSFFEKYPNLLPRYIEAFTKQPHCDILELLGALRKNRINVDKDTVKELTKSFIEKKGMTGELYESYLLSLSEKNPYTYLDQELFDDAILKLESSGNSANIASFFDIYKHKEGKSGEEHQKALSLSPEKEKSLYHLSFKVASGLSSLFNYNKEFFANELKSLINKEEKGLSFGHISYILQDKKISLPVDVESDFIKYITDDLSFEKSRFSQKEIGTLIDDYIERYKDRGIEYTDKFKDPILKGANTNVRRTMLLKFLQNNLLNTSEIQQTFHEVRKGEDLRDQVLTCASILGTLVFRDNKDQDSSPLLAFFGGENKGQKEKLEKINAFETKYSLEEKGRTIVTMLFAKEYMPEREPGEILDKVISRIRKYEKVLERYEYKNIPEGLHVSLGMEYEITGSTSDGYRNLTGRDLSRDIKRLSEIAKIGQGRDAVHEVATRPVTNPYLLMLEIDILRDLEYLDFNFERTPEYQKGSRGFHLTIGGERGLEVNANTQFLQNLMLMASWGGIHAGETGKRAYGGRGVAIRGRYTGDSNNVKVFDNQTSSIELRSLSIDKVEPFERTVLSSFHGAVAVQALEEYGLSSLALSELTKKHNLLNGEAMFEQAQKDQLFTKEITDVKVKQIITTWMDMLVSVSKAVAYHNENFLEGETKGYLDTDNTWVDTDEFGGQYNKKRFEEVVQSINPSESVEEYLDSTLIESKDIFGPYSTNFADKLTKVNNLYLKPSRHMKGDQANATAMLEVTKTDNQTVEMREAEFLESSIFEMLGEKRKGYYTLQGASDRMVTHAIQKILLEFNARMEKILN